MKVKGITIEALERCLLLVNKRRGYQLEFNKQPYYEGRWINFTIRSKLSGIPGSRTAPSGRKLTSASWHAHGYLFDKIYDINPESIITTSFMRYTCREDNWQDYNIGTLNKPCFISTTSILTKSEQTECGIKPKVQKEKQTVSYYIRDTAWNNSREYLRPVSWYTNYGTSTVADELSNTTSS